MPKDATKNVDRYKIRGGQLNEFEYTENQRALAEDKSQSRGKLIPGTPPEQLTDRVKPAAAKKSTKKSGKAASGTKAAQATSTNGGKARSAGRATNSTGKATKSTGKAAKGTKAGKAPQGTKQSSTRGASARKLAARKAAKK